MTSTLLMEKEYNKREVEVEKYVVQIDEDPSTQIDIFLSQLQKVNKYSQRVGTLALNALKNEHYCKVAHDLADKAYKDGYSKIMDTKSKEMAELKNQALRDAAASAFLENEAANLLKATHNLERAKVHQRIMNKKLEGLKDTGDKISRQISVVEQMIKLGLLRGVEE